jgi:hypothetical protein
VQFITNTVDFFGPTPIMKSDEETHCAIYIVLALTFEPPKALFGTLGHVISIQRGLGGLYKISE